MTRILVTTASLAAALGGLAPSFWAAESTQKAGLPVRELQRSSAVDFEKEVLPLLRGSCLACHNRTKAKAELILEAPADMLKGGESGPAVVPGKPQESLLFKLAAHIEKPIMPPKENKVEAANLTPEQLGLLQLWIQQGATGEVKASEELEWQALPAGLNSIVSLALSADGQWAAAGRGNQISIYHLPTHRMTGLLTDPELIREGLYSKPGVAHRDLVNALAFSPDGNWLASGDYRVVRLWHRQSEHSRTGLLDTNLGPATALASSPDGQWLGTGHASGRVALWKINEGLQLTQWVAHSHGIQELRFSPSGSRLATLSGSSRVGIWTPFTNIPPFYLQTPAAVSAISWLSNDVSLACAGTDAAIRTWTLPQPGQTNAQMTAELKGHVGRVTALQGLAQGTVSLISAGTDGTVRGWEAGKAESITKSDHGGPVTALALHPDGRSIASAGSNSVTKLWNIADGKALFELKGDRFADDAVAAADRDLNFAKAEAGYRQGALDEARKREKAEADFSAKALDNRVAAEKSLTEKQKALLAAVESRAAAEKAPAEMIVELQKVNADRDAAENAARPFETEASAAKARVGQIRAAAEQAKKAAAELAKLIESDPTKTQGLREAREAAEKTASTALALAEDANKVADRLAQDAAPRRKAADEAKAAADKKVAEIHERQKKAPERLAAALKEMQKLEKEAESLVAARKSSEDQLLAAQGAARKAAEAVPDSQKALETAQAQQKARELVVEQARVAAANAHRPVLSLTFDPTIRALITAGQSGLLQHWATQTGVGLNTYDHTNNPLVAITSVGAGTLAAIGRDGVPIRIRRAEKWELVRTIGSLKGPSPLLGRINALEFSSDGKKLAIGSGEPSRSGQLAIWNAESNHWSRIFTNAHSDVVQSVSFSSDNRLLASAASDRFVKVWDAATGAMVKSFEGHTHHVMGVSWKRDGRTLASAGADRVVKLWNFVTGEQRRTIAGAEKELTAIRYIDATGEWLVASGDSQIRVLAEDGKTVRSFGGAKDFVQAACITPDGRWVVGGGADSVLRLWNGKDGSLLKAFDP